MKATIPNRGKKAKSGLLLFQLAQPFLRLRAHVFRRRSAETGPALHRTVDRQHAEHVLADSRLDLAHGGGPRPVSGRTRSAAPGLRFSGSIEEPVVNLSDSLARPGSGEVQSTISSASCD